MFTRGLLTQSSELSVHLSTQFTFIQHVQIPWTRVVFLSVPSTHRLCKIPNRALTDSCFTCSATLSCKNLPLRLFLPQYRVISCHLTYLAFATLSLGYLDRTSLSALSISVSTFPRQPYSNLYKLYSSRTHRSLFYRPERHPHNAYLNIEGNGWNRGLNYLRCSA